MNVFFTQIDSQEEVCHDLQFSVKAHSMNLSFNGVDLCDDSHLANFKLTFLRRLGTA